MIVHLLRTDGDTNEFISLSGKDEYVIGREEGDLVLGDERCSRRHAVLCLNENNELVVRDLKSTNGVIVNKKRVPEAVLKPEDTFRLGRTLFLFFGYQLQQGADANGVQISRNPINIGQNPAETKTAVKAVPNPTPAPSQNTRAGGQTQTKAKPKGGSIVTQVPICIDPRGDGSEAENQVAPTNLGSMLLTTWPDNFRSLQNEAVVNFIDHMDEDQKRKSRRLIAYAKPDERKDDAA